MRKSVRQRHEVAMGAWGIGNFDNDDASDWLFELQRAEGPALLETTFVAVTECPGYLEAPVASTALAAGEVLAALLGSPAASLPEAVTGWLASNPVVPAANLQRAAVDAIDRILENSELKDLWAESPEGENWTRQVQSLRARLAS